MFLGSRLGVEALKIPGRPHCLTMKVVRAREGGRREGIQDGNWLGRPRSCRRCSPYWLLSPTPLEGTHLPSINLVVAFVEGSGGSGRSARA
jgi:hypothetical protein